MAVVLTVDLGRGGETDTRSGTTAVVEYNDGLAQDIGTRGGER